MACQETGDRRQETGALARAFGVLVCTLAPLLSPAGAGAQPGDDATPVEALTCWRRVERPAVHVGERFGVTVTCRVVETDDARTLLDVAPLEPEAIDVTPFEVLSGERFEDVESGVFRFLQYRYTLRIIDEGSFGDDVELPALDLTYRIERRVGDNPALLGRELSHILPPDTVRVLSLVPDASVDILDLPPPTLGETQTRVFRANVLTLLAGLAGVLALGVVALGAARVLRERRGDTTPVETLASRPRIVRQALAELQDVQAATVDRGWSPESAGRALAALRLGGSVAVSAPIAQQVVDAETERRDGQLRLRLGWLRRRTLLVSSGLTADALSRRLGDTNGDAPDTHLGRAIALFTAARFGRNGDLPTDELTRELDAGIAELKQLRWRSTSPVRYATELRRRVRELARTWRR